MQTEGQRRASLAVEHLMASRNWSNAWLIDRTGLDKGTVGPFLAGDQWPRRGTLAKIEAALGWSVGTISGIADGRVDPPPIETVSADDHDDDSLLFRRPDGLSDQEWVELRERMRGGWEWELRQADRER